MRLQPQLLVFALLGVTASALAACGSDDPATSDAASSSSTTTASSSSGSGGGMVAHCADDEHLDAGACDTEIGWSPGPALPLPRDHHGTFLVDPGPSAARFLYVVGGFSQSEGAVLGSVSRAPVADDGTLGAWSGANGLPEGAAGMGVAIVNDTVILAGGYVSAKTWTGKIGADGSIDAWTAGPALSGNRFHTTATAFKSFVFVVGGIDGNNTSDEVQRATVSADGTLGAFSVVAHLPYSLSHHVALLDGATLYLIGGQTGNVNVNAGTPHKETLVATLGDDGSLSAFTMGPELPMAYETSAGILHDGFAYIVGGVLDTTASEASGVQTNRVVRAAVLGPGQLGPWAFDDGSQLPAARSHVHHLPVFGSHVYSVSGMGAGSADTPNVDVGEFQ